jgi:hypothetical protein
VTASLNGEISQAEAKEVLSVISEHFKNICELLECDVNKNYKSSRLNSRQPCKELNMASLSKLRDRGTLEALLEAGNSRTFGT